MKNSIKCTVGQHWFKFATAKHSDPSKLPKGSLSICLVPIQLPEGCQLVSGVSAALIIARAVGDDKGIEWIAIDAEWKQALCQGVLQMENYTFNEWFQLLDHGTTVTTKQRTVDNLRQMLTEVPKSF